MFENIRGLVIKHTGMFIALIIVILALVVIGVQLFNKIDETSEATSNLREALDVNASKVYNNKILTGSQVLDAIRKYYNHSEVMLLLFNNASDYDNTADRFWVSTRQAKFGQSTIYDNTIISSKYTDIKSIVIQDKSIQGNYTRKPLNSFSSNTERNYIKISSKYKSVLIRCNDLNMGMAFFAI